MDKNLKKAADKIKMPEDMKERIINTCELAETKGSNTDDNDGYIDVVSSSERVNTRSHIIRTISTVAACAVLIGGLGATGVFLHRHRNTQMPSSEEIDELECKSLTFDDFSTFDYIFDAGDGKNGKYSAETYEKISDYLNSFNWGSELEEYETRPMDKDAEDSFYNINWTRGDTPPVECNIRIANDGFVTYTESMMDFENGSQKPLADNSRCYKIDFDAFEGGIQDILSQEKSDPTPFGDFTTFDFSFSKDNNYYDKKNGEVYEKIADFLNNFKWGEEVIESEQGTTHQAREVVYNVDWQIGERFYYFYIDKDGQVNYGEGIKDNGTQAETIVDKRKYKIDFIDFEIGLAEIGLDIDSSSSDSGEEITSNDESITLSEDELIYDADGNYDFEANMKRIDQKIEKYLESFEDLRIEVSIEDENQNELVAADEQSREQLEIFLKNDFESMLKYDFSMYDSTSEGKYKLIIVKYNYMSGDKEVFYKAYTVLNNNSVVRSDCKRGSGEDEWHGPYPFEIDYNAFITKLSEFGL